MISIQSKLPDVGTTIFSVMSGLAHETGAINLSQGFPDFPIPEALAEGVTKAIRDGHNQYAPMPGLPALQEAIAEKIQRTLGVSVHPAHEITITAGATQAIFSLAAALVRPGDEVILLDPCYDAYAPSVRLQGGLPIRVPLSADFCLDQETREAVARALTPRTRLLVINTPGNPSGRVLTAADLGWIATQLRGSNTLLLSDEVYEHLIFDGKAHASALAHSELRERTFGVFSFGKVFHATGWKVGYVVAPPPLTAEFRKAHQFTVFSVNTPVQHALAAHLETPEPWREMAETIEGRRNTFRDGLEHSRFRLLPCEGSYFQLAEYGAIRDEADLAFAIWLTRTHGVATIPLSPFYENPPEGQRLVRLCFAKREETLAAALERLCQI
jgi:methionine aminotransferase